MKDGLKRRIVLAVSAVGAAAALWAVVPATAEQQFKAGVFIYFRGSYSPKRIPRHRLAPISLILEGGARGEDGAPPPRLRQIEIAFGGRGGLDTTDLPVCSRSQLEYATQSQALVRCRGAVVGHGEIEAEVPFNQGAPFKTHAGVVVFNGRSHGRPAAWVHAYSSTPPVSFVLPFYFSQSSVGTYGVTMRSPVGNSLGRWPLLRSFKITLGRRYSAGGRRHSYLSAHCPLGPRKLTHVSVPFARATYEFAPRPRISQPIRRFCRVRE
jgi:hypothetical protein